MGELNTIINEIESHARFAIYGAQVVGYGIYRALKQLYGLTPECFLVSQQGGDNPAVIDGIRVNTIQEYSSVHNKDEVLLIIAVTEVYQKEICMTAAEHGFKHLLSVTGHIEHLIMSGYFEQNSGFKLLEGIACPDGDADISSQFKVFTVRNKQDKAVTKTLACSDWEQTIQSGAALVHERIAEYADNTGLNISGKNPQYCELCATYWVWKNIDCDWKGIAHYRRRLKIDKQQVLMLLQGGADAVLPLPYICYPDAMTQLKRFLSDETISAFHNAVKTVIGLQADNYWQLLGGEYKYAYNMFCAKSSVFEEYCEFIFAILETVERQNNMSGFEPRSLAYMGELITTMFFLRNRDRFRIVHAEKEVFTA